LQNISALAHIKWLKPELLLSVDPWLKPGAIKPFQFIIARAFRPGNTMGKNLALATN